MNKSVSHAWIIVMCTVLQWGREGAKEKVFGERERERGRETPVCSGGAVWWLGLRDNSKIMVIMDGWNVTKLWVFKGQTPGWGVYRERDANEKGLVRGVVGADYWHEMTCVQMGMNKWVWRGGCVWVFCHTLSDIIFYRCSTPNSFTHKQIKYYTTCMKILKYNELHYEKISTVKNIIPNR